MDNKALVYLELATDQIFYINGFKKETIEPYLNTENEPRGLYAMWQEFDLIFNKTTKIPKIEKFYYPIVFSRWEFPEIINEISIHPKIIKRIRTGQCKILMTKSVRGMDLVTWWDELATILRNKI